MQHARNLHVGLGRKIAAGLFLGCATLSAQFATLPDPPQKPGTVRFATAGLVPFRGGALSFRPRLEVAVAPGADVQVQMTQPVLAGAVQFGESWLLSRARLAERQMVGMQVAYSVSNRNTRVFPHYQGFFNLGTLGMTAQAGPEWDASALVLSLRGAAGLAIPLAGKALCGVMELHEKAGLPTGGPVAVTTVHGGLHWAPGREGFQVNGTLTAEDLFRGSPALGLQVDVKFPLSSDAPPRPLAAPVALQDAGAGDP